MLPFLCVSLFCGCEACELVCLRTRSRPETLVTQLLCRYLGQVLAGPPAVEALQKGIELIRRELQAVVCGVGWERGH